jgi:carboxypeptidase Q
MRGFLSRRRYYPGKLPSIASILLAVACSTVTLTTHVDFAEKNSVFSEKLLSEMRQLQQMALKSDYALKQADYLCNNIGPRLSGSPQAQRAVEYVAGEMRKLGLEVRLEVLSVPHWVRGTETGSLVNFPGQAGGSNQKIVLTALGGSIATPPGGITAQVVVVEDFDELQSLGRQKIEGKIVMFNKRFDSKMAGQGYGLEAYRQAVVYRRNGPSAAARSGAAAVIIRSVGGAAFRLPHTGSTIYSPDAPAIPAAAVTVEDADLIERLTRQGIVRMQLTLTPRQLPDAIGYNVIADLKGTVEPNEVVIVSGHLDSWDLGTGAIDDASGVAVAMEVMRLVKQLGLKPKRTIRFIAWMNEENGLAGGQTYAKNREKELINHIAAIESDHGAGHPLGFDVTGRAELLDLLQPVQNVLESSGAGLMRPAKDAEADVTPLASSGVPAFGIWQDSRTYFDYHHTAADTFDKIVPAELAENAAAMSVLAYAIADIPVRLPR